MNSDQSGAFMAAGSSFANLNSALMLNYDTGFKGRVSWSHGVLAAMIKKVKGSGLKCVIPMEIGDAVSVSSTFVDAQTLAQTTFSEVEQYSISWTKKYGVAQIDGLLLEASSDSKGGIFDKFAGQIDGLMRGTMSQFSNEVYRNGFGSVGRVGSAATGEVLASTTLQLQNPEDIVHFAKGQQFNCALTDHSDLLRTGGALCTIAGILDLNKGTILLAAQLATTLPDVAFGDFIFLRGNRQNSATPTPLCIQGLDTWFPATVPGAGVDATGLDRSQNALLRGTVIDVSNNTKNKEDAVIDAVTASSRFGGQPGNMVYFTNPTNYKELILLGMNKFRPTTVKGPYGIGFQGVKVQTDNGEIPVMPDRFCPVQRSYLLEMSTVKYYGCGSAEIPRFLSHDDAGQVLRVTNDDAVECRVGYYGAIGCNNCPVNVVVVHSTT